MRFILATLAILVFACLIGAQELKLTGDGIKTVEVERMVVVKTNMQVAQVPFQIQAPAGAFSYRWKVPAGVIVADDESDTLEVTAAPKGTLTVFCRVTTIKVEAGNVVPARQNLQLTFAVGEAVPPKPPEPKPPVVPVGFRVLLVHEAQDGSPAFFDGRAVKLYLDAKTVKDGTHPSWRRIDKDQAGVNLPKDLKQIWEASKSKVTTLPAVIIAVNETVTIHALPKDEAALIALLKLHGGN